MHEVEGPSKSFGRHVLSSLGFWGLALVAVVLFGLSVLARPLAERRATLEKQAGEQAIADRWQQRVDDLAVIQQALADDPEYVARRARDDLGYRKSGEQRLPFDVETASLSVEPVKVVMPPMTRLERICRRFESPVARSAAMIVSVMALAMAMLLFEVPTRPRAAKA